MPATVVSLSALRRTLPSSVHHGASVCLTKASLDDAGGGSPLADRIDYELPPGVLTEDADGFHVPPNGDWLQLETNWVWFFVPERKLGCWAYHFIRPTIGLDAGSIQVWDDSAWHHTEIPDYRQGLTGPLPDR